MCTAYCGVTSVHFLSWYFMWTHINLLLNISLKLFAILPVIYILTRAHTPENICASSFTRSPVPSCNDILWIFNIPFACFIVPYFSLLLFSLFTHIYKSIFFLSLRLLLFFHFLSTVF